MKRTAGILSFRAWCTIACLECIRQTPTSIYLSIVEITARSLGYQTAGFSSHDNCKIPKKPGIVGCNQVNTWYKFLSILNKAENVSITYGFPNMESPVTQIDTELDARGLTCPMPLLKLKQNLNKMEEGQVIRVQTTDPGSLRDFEAFLRQVSSELIDQTENEQGEYCFLIKK